MILIGPVAVRQFSQSTKSQQADMNLDLDAELETKLTALASSQGTTPAEYLRLLLRQQVVPRITRPLSKEEFERLLRSVGTPCGVSLTDEDLSRETMYD